MQRIVIHSSVAVVCRALGKQSSLQEISQQSTMSFPCHMCNVKFAQRHSLLRHVRYQHANLWTCATCKAIFGREDNFQYHRRTCDFRTTGKRPTTEQDRKMVRLYIPYTLEFTRIKIYLET